MHPLEIVSLISLAFWVTLTLDRKRSWPHGVILSAAEVGPSADTLGSVVAIVPARNEAEMLPRTLPSLLRQEEIDLRVVLVDDGSTDSTVETARRLSIEQATSVDLQIVRAGPRVEGWSGKVHAQLCGYEAALERVGEPPEWLLLADADIHHRPGSVQSLLRQAGGLDESGAFDLVSIMARLQAEGFWERLIIPAFVFFFQLLYPFRRVSERNSRVAAAAGGCVLVRRSALENAGGFAAVAAEIIDDVALGRAVKKSGGAIWLGLDPGIVSLRNYAGLGDLWQMVSRTAFTQLNYRWGLLVVTLMALGIFLVSPPVVLALGIAASWPFESVDSMSLIRAEIWVSLAWTLSFVAFLPAIRHHGVPWYYAATLPVAGILFGLMTAGSACRDLLGRGPTWKDRSYESSRGSGPPPSR